ATPRLSYDVWPRIRGGLPELLGDRRRIQRYRRPPREPRREVLGGVARSTRETAGLQAADGVDVSVGLLVRRRLQFRLQRLADGGATARGTLRIQLSTREADAIERRRGIRRRDRGDGRNRRSHLPAPAAG